MTAAAMASRDSPNIRRACARTQTKIPSAIMLMPNDTKRVTGTERLTKLTIQHRTINRRYGYSFKIHQDRLFDDLSNQRMFQPKNGTSLELQNVLL